MPGMNGITLLRRIKLEMDLPVIMMSADTRPKTLIEAARHGSCYYLFKPLHMSELMNIWQHVIRKQCQKFMSSSSSEDSDGDAESHPLINDDLGDMSKSQKRKIDADEDEDDSDNSEDSSSKKRSHMVWTDMIHKKFLDAVNKLGIDKAVPMKILELMPGHNLTREHISSHLQKYRLHLRKLARRAQQQNELNSSCGSVEQNAEANSRGRFGFPNLAPLGQVLPQISATLNSQILGQSSGSNMLPEVNQLAFPGTSRYYQPSSNCQTNVLQQFHHSNVPSQDLSSDFSTGFYSKLGTVSSAANLGVVDNGQNGNMLFPRSEQQQTHAVLPEPQHAATVQTSCLELQPLNNFQIGGNTVPMNQASMVAPCQSMFSFQPINNSVAVNQLAYNGRSNMDNAFNGSNNLEQGLIPSLSSNVPYSMGQILDGGLTNFDMGPGTRTGVSLGQEEGRNFDFVGTSTCIPTWFAVDDVESPITNLDNSNVGSSKPEDLSPRDFINDLPE